MWQQTKQFVGPVLAGALLALLLVPASLVWSLLAVVAVVLIAVRFAVSATAAVSAKGK